MAHTPDFVLEDMLYALNPVIEQYAEGSKERAATELAQIALLYIPTREEADKWLASGTAKDRERVKIAGKGFMAVEVTGRLRLMPAPLPEELETDEWKDGSK